MPTQAYTNREGKRVPGVTTVIGQNLGWNKGPLMYWANKEGREGRELYKKDSTATVAAEIGTVVHDMIEDSIHGRDAQARIRDALGLTAEDLEKARRGFRQYERWNRGSTITVIGTEMFGVDEEYQTGFCADGWGTEEDADGKLIHTLLDWKTSKGTYADHFIQVSAYAMLMERQMQETQPGFRFATAHVLRVAKDSGTFSHKSWERDELEVGWKAFTWLRALHQVRKEIEEKVK